jgi:23S rRNA pseudouridine2605 synthase
MYTKGNKREEKGGKKPFTKTTAARKSSAADRSKKTAGTASNGNARLAKVTGKKSFGKNRNEDQFAPNKSRSSTSTRTDGKFDRSKPRSSSSYDKRSTSSSEGERKPYSRSARTDEKFDRNKTRSSSSYDKRSTSSSEGERKSYSRSARTDEKFDRNKTRSSGPYDKRSTSSSEGERKPYSRSATTDGKFDRSKSRSSSSYDKRSTSSTERGRKPYSTKTDGKIDRTKSYTNRTTKPTSRLDRVEKQGERTDGKIKPRTIVGSSKVFEKVPGFRTRSNHNTNYRTEISADQEKPKSRSGRGPLRSEAIFDRKKARKAEQAPQTNIRLNRYIANAGICSRREADDLIGAGLVSVNGAVITEMGYQVKPGDDVRYNGERLSIEKKVYLLLNKPKDAITTFDDPEGRRTVMQLFGKELGERVYPVGRLDRNTTGVLFFTNDGDLAQRLMHPKYEMKKVYKATLDKNLKGEDIWQLTNGVELEDGFIKPDAIAIPDPKFKNEVGVEIHSGKNRIIHRIFEHLGYKVDKLDRALYAGLTKGKLKRGEWRELTEKEVNALKRLVRLG